MLVSRGPAFWSGWVMSALIYSAKKISEQRKWVRGCTNVKIGHERPKTLGWGVYTRVLLDRPEYKRHNGPLDFLFGQALFMGLLKNCLDQFAHVLDANAFCTAQNTFDSVPLTMLIAWNISICCSICLTSNPRQPKYLDGSCIF